MSMANNNNIKVDQSVANIVASFRKVSKTTMEDFLTFELHKCSYFATNNGNFSRKPFT